MGTGSLGGAAPLGRRVLAELVGTAALVAAVVGSGIQASALSGDTGVRLLANSLASAVALGLLIAQLGPVSGGHLNPVVTLCAWWSRRRAGVRVPAREVALYLAAQPVGAVAGALLAEAMFGRAPGGAGWSWATRERADAHLLLGETVATAGLVLLIVALERLGRARFAPLAVAAYIGAAIWFTSSGSFANPAATVGRSLTDSFTGIAPGSLPGFVAAQSLGALLGAALAGLLYGAGSPAAGRATGAAGAGGMAGGPVPEGIGGGMAAGAGGIAGGAAAGASGVAAGAGGIAGGVAAGAGGVAGGPGAVAGGVAGGPVPGVASRGPGTA
ncbi:aquaporin [Streptomyces sp. enrichment culture]|uniref:aquaporin n=1 Tax=Streptomyces sp. enrichment culture TaxID=1795815 RepID=UPI003F54A713